MFWNDPNLYSVAFKDIPNFPNPFLGPVPRYYNPYPAPPAYFTPPIAPQMFGPQVPPAYFTPPVTPFMHSQPLTPFMHTPPVTPFMHATMPRYDFGFPYYQGYRPFGL